MISPLSVPFAPSLLFMFADCIMQQQHASLCRGPICPNNCIHTAPLRQILQIKLAISPGHRIITPAQPVLTHASVTPGVWRGDQPVLTHVPVTPGVWRGGQPVLTHVPVTPGA